MNDKIILNENFANLLKKFGAIHSPNCQAVKQNINNSVQDNRVYMGTYFPRTVSEIMAIFGNIFQTQKFNHLWMQERVRILSFGSGLGGDILGLICQLEKVANYVGMAVPFLEIVAIDCNQTSLAQMKQIMTEVMNHLELSGSVTPVMHFAKNDDMLPASNEIKETFDIILTSKALNEIYDQGHPDVYEDFCRAYLPLLKEKGVALISDVTSKSSTMGGEYFSILCNRGITRALATSAEFTTLLPLGCNKCHQCQSFTQKIIECSIKEFWQTPVASRITYRLIGRKGQFADLENISLNNTYVVKGEFERCGQKYRKNCRGDYIPRNVRAVSGLSFPINAI